MRHFLIPCLSRVRAENGGLGVFSRGWTHQRRCLSSSVLLLGIRGRVSFVVDGEELQLTAGRVVVLPAGVPHAGLGPVNDATSYFWLHFTVDDLRPLLSQAEADTILSNEGVSRHLLDEAALLPLSFDLAEPGPFVAEFRELLNRQENPSYTPWLLQVLFQQLLIHLTEAVLRTSRRAGGGSSSSVVYGILACVAENLTDPDLSIKTIASTLGLNLDYAGRRFKQVMGTSVGDFIRRERIKLALARLKGSSDTLEAIASATGFGSLRHFLRQFKAEQGLTPTEVRRRHRMMHINTL